MILGVTVLTFALMHLAPGSPWHRGDGGGGTGVQLSEAAVRNLNTKYGLDRPWWQQLAVYVGNAARLDFGESYRYRGQEVRELIILSWPRTFVLGTIAFMIIVSVGMGLGVWAALKKGSFLDHAVTGLATFGAAVPNLLVGIFLIVLFSVGLNRLTRGAFFLPSGGFGLDEHLILPVVTLSILPVAFVARLTRASTLEVLSQDHVRTARAKGLPERRVVTGHVVKNALVPIVTALGPLFAFLITGAVVVENLFQIPGIGGTFVRAVSQRDYPVILGTSVVYAAVFAVVNLVVDVAYVLIDPRVRGD